MNQPVKTKVVPAWLRGLGWLAFSILGLVTLLIVGRWLLMEQGHQMTLKMVASQRDPSPPRVPGVATVSNQSARGLPLSSLPYFGGVLAGDEKKWTEFEKTFLAEISKLSHYKRTHRERVGGVLSFRAVLMNLGVDVPETMTEAEAAAEYLKKVDRFSDLLGQWKEAVAKGPLERAADLKSDPNIWRFGSMRQMLSLLLADTAMAHLQTGDGNSAWSDWQALKNSWSRECELFPEGSGRDGQVTHQMYNVARLGIQSGGWTDAQLAEISNVAGQEHVLASAQEDILRQKERWTDYYEHFSDHEEEFSREFMRTDSSFYQMMNQAKLKLITPQQIQDNLDATVFEVDQQLARFDPATGFYIQPKETEPEESPGMLDSFYFMIKNLESNYDNQSMAAGVIYEQSRYDQLRLAAALETYQHRTGKYPDHLDVVSDQFPAGAPLDIATGQPYFYQRDADGGYTLWGTGIDGKSNGGDDKADVTWRRTAISSGPR